MGVVVVVVVGLFFFFGGGGGGGGGNFPLFKERICFSRSKFFPLRVNPGETQGSKGKVT